MADEGETTPAWNAAVIGFRRELETRGDVRAHAARVRGRPRGAGPWASERGSEPATLSYRDLRSYAAALSGRGLAKSSVARKLTAVRSFHDHLVRAGAAEQNPAELLPTPKADSKLPRVLGPDEIAGLLNRIPARTPLEIRDRAMFELTYSCGLRAEEIVDLDVDSPDFDAETLRVEGKGSKTRIMPIGEPAQRALQRYLERARSALDPAPGETALFLSRRGRRLSTSDVRRRLTSGCARPPWRGESRRTPFVTRSRRTCWRAGPTCDRSRSSWGTRASRPPRSTLGSSPAGFERIRDEAIHERDAGLS